MNPLHISGVLQSGTRHSWVNFYSGERETSANVIFALMAKGKIHDSVSMTLQEGKNIEKY